MKWAWLAIVALFFVYAGDAPPNVNEAHYLVKAKNFWDPDWCRNDLFASSGKAHAFFYWTFGWLTQFVSLEATAWVGRLIGWALLAFGLVRLTRSMALPPISGLIVAMVWIAGIERGNLAGEWVVGGIEAKVPAYGLVLIGLSELVAGRWNRVWIALGLASAFHVLTGGWSVVAAAIAFWVTQRSRWRTTDQPHRFFSAGLFAGGALSLLGLWPALSMSAGATAAESVSAAKTYAYFRISHHLLPSAFHADWYVRHGVLTILTLIALRIDWRTSDAERRPRVLAIASVAIGAMAISLAGLAVGVLPAVAPDWAAKLLRFYWFRLADATTPLALGLCAASFCSRWVVSARTRPPFVAAFGAGLLLISCFFVARSTWQRTTAGVPISVSNRLLGLEADADYATQRRRMRDWIEVCRFVRANTPEDAVLLTPRHQQSFKWYAHRAEVVNWKDIPQDVLSLREWSRRFVEIFPAELSTMRVTIRYDRLRHFRRRYDVDWMIVDRRVVGPHLPLVQVYPIDDERNATYAIYRLPSSLPDP